MGERTRSEFRAGFLAGQLRACRRNQLAQVVQGSCKWVPEQSSPGGCSPLLLFKKNYGISIESDVDDVSKIGLQDSGAVPDGFTMNTDPLGVVSKDIKR